ncbi:dystroglycan 1 isoform X1 [Amyelois transitella]|uniref:dystroglycan 1 isoform X1 n=1 Tax=Amyelois transitella TaxID=680683 RepID=UPI00298FFCAB|nr:dystroglycan 1 isoform X1 [Amyelois transitella]XP_060805474.1 dystroglycan 1 isoform X1 [Amyelois transitella]XP_060805475.1 dystroglycan 1 isoform X1 [Amyelois transitella]XP_060805476.1 dystroglycan 1 isoform X1 [Amyelois transitella]XP_060805477.1 dystroglycan 1 isoform X1 [Amyelois transitella]XP_060805478.1 dystroglycan 1 isoform X1 [Amyelois transitella]
MARALYIVCALLTLCPLALSRLDEDFAFDNSEEFQVELTANHSEITKNGLKRLWGVPDTSAYVGHLFRMEIPKEAFSGEVQAYKIRREDGRRTPSWLAVDSKHGLISGLPQHADLGAHTFTVTAHGQTKGLTATDSFTIEVKKAEEKPHSKYGSCVRSENKLVLVILIDGQFQYIAPRQRIRALMELANFMAIDGDEFWMEPYKTEAARTQTVLMSGPGTTQRRRSDAATAIYLNVGCNDKLWSRHKVLVAGLREQSRDGTLAHVLRLPVLGWRLLAVKPAPRHKRQSIYEEGSGQYDDYDNEEDPADADYSGYDEDKDDSYTDLAGGPLTDNTEDVKITPYDATSASESSSVNYTQEVPFTPRRIGSSYAEFPLENATDPPLPTTTEAELQTVIIRESELPISSSEPPTSIPSPTPLSTTSTTSTTEMPVPLPPVIVPTTVLPNTTLPPTTTPKSTVLTSAATVTTTPTEASTLEVTKFQEYSSSERSSTIIGRTTETVTFAMPANQPPTLKHHMKKLAIIAGKAFRYIIPADLFTDPEDGSNLTFTMYEAENVPLSKDSWIQFIPSGREVYGLPLERHVSRWNFIVEAQDSEGLIARGPLDITVQQHKSGRTINHQFVMQFELLKQYNNVIDWQIRALEGIVNLFRDTDMHHLTVLNATQNGNICEFVWTNDTLPKDPVCPMDDINRLMKIMESESEPGAPAANLSRAMSPQLQVLRVRWRGAGRCARPAPPPARAPDTYPPVTRNQVDHLTATVGHLLVYKVPEDTFFDPEDGSTRNLALSLRYSDRSELPRGHWLQFDEKNQEFYGLPAPGDEGSVHYQLIAEDSSKKSAYDSLIVEVVKSPTIKPTVEFQMTMDYPFPQLAYDANNKRKVVEKLAALFGQKETDNIRIQSITNNPTTIIWYNTSLPMDRCPKKEIEDLRKMIIIDERGTAGGAALKDNVDHVFDKDLKVMSIRLIPLGLCAEQNTKVPKTTIQVHPGSTNLLNSKADTADASYLVTFIIPAVVIVCMILVAGIIACVLYRRRRTAFTGKMSVGDEEERQAFRSKGIPVIFQDELEERGDSEPVHKSPVIMREEKPPLLPPAPEYRSGEDVPYRPPPPFPASRTPPRPKATPTYRKPPPYVPP